MRNYEKVNCVCQTETMEVFDDGISMHISVYYDPQKRFGLKQRWRTIWKAIQGYDAPKTCDMVLVNEERKKLLDVLECIAHPMVTGHVQHYKSTYPFFETPIKRSHHKKKPTKVKP